MKEKVLEAVDIVELIGETVALSRKGKEFVGLCPFHPDQTPSLSVSPAKQIFKCWSCGAGGDVIAYVQRREKITFREALERLAQRAGIRLDRQNPHGESTRAPLRAALNWARDWFQQNLGAAQHANARQYAGQRGLKPETVAAFSVGFAPAGWDNLVRAAEKSIAPNLLDQAGLTAVSPQGRRYDRFRNRLMFPITDALGRVIAFGGRTLENDPAKYLNSPESPLFSKSRVLFGFHQARDAIVQQRVAIVVEGYMDAVLLHQAGFRNTVATLGTALTGAHLKILSPVSDSLLLCFDGDEAGARAAERAAEIALNHAVTVKVVLLPAGMDPADCVQKQGADAFQRLLLTAVDALEFKWSQTLATFGSDLRAQRAAIEEFVKFIAQSRSSGVVDPLHEGMVISRLSELTRLSPDTLYALLARARLAARPGKDNSTASESSYDLGIRGLPPALVCSFEELVGALLGAPLEADVLLPEVERAGEVCEVWGRLAGVMKAALQQGRLTTASVVDGCDSAELLEAVDRAIERVRGADCGPAARAAADRLKLELDAWETAAQRAAMLQRDGKDPDAHEAFVSLLGTARAAHGRASSAGWQLEHHWNSHPG